MPGAPRRSPGRRSTGAVAAAREYGSPYHLALVLMDCAKHLAAAADGVRAAESATEVRQFAERLRCEPPLRRAAVIAGEPVVHDLADMPAG